MIALTTTANPPRHLILGEWGYSAVVENMRQRLEEVESQRTASLAADYPKG
jgi:hypothetical protein